MAQSQPAAEAEQRPDQVAPHSDTAAQARHGPEAEPQVDRPRGQPPHDQDRHHRPEAAREGQDQQRPDQRKQADACPDEVAQANPLVRLQHAPQARRDDEERQRGRQQVEGDERLALQRPGDLEHSTDQPGGDQDDQGRPCQTQGRHQPQGGPDQVRDIALEPETQPLGDQLGQRAAEAEVEQAEIPEDHPGQGEHSESVCTETADQHRDGHNRHRQGRDLAQEIPDRIPAQQAAVCQHGRCFATPWGMIRMSDQVMEPPRVLILPTPKGGGFSVRRRQPPSEV